MKFDETVDGFLADHWRHEPTAATYLGVDGFDDRVGDLSSDGIARREANEDEWLARFRAFQDADLDDVRRIDRDLAISQLRGRQILRAWQEWKRQPAMYLDEGIEGVFALFLHRALPEPELVAAAEQRLRAIPDLLAAAKENLDANLASPVFVERARSQCEGSIGYVRDTVPTHAADESLRKRLRDAGETAARAYEDFGRFLAAFDARGPFAIGSELYSALLREREMLPYGVEEMRERGREAFDQLSGELAKRASDMRGDDDWRALLAELANDHPKTPDEMRREYAEWTERARRFVYERELCSETPGERCEVVPSPEFQRATLAVASYQSPPAFRPSLTGHFFVPYPPAGVTRDEEQKRLRSNAFYEIPTVSVHEAYPGHHWHTIRMYANPRKLRRVMGSAYFSEGWALYTERMMLENGFYDDPRHEVGVIHARIFRAARIIVDTSLHIGDMTFDEAARFLVENSGMSEPTARAEAGRYCSWPTQAPSYLTGALEVERIRSRFTGDLRTFHDEMCSSGSLPMGLAERAVLG
jgi:uncharacterized protein (DUF885 family)